MTPGSQPLAQDPQDQTGEGGGVVLKLVKAAKMVKMVKLVKL